MLERSLSELDTTALQVDYATLLDTLEEGVVMQDAAGVMRYLNARARALLRLGDASTPFAPRLPWTGPGTGSVLGMPVHEVFATGEALVSRVVGLGRGSERRWLSLNATPWWNAAGPDERGVSSTRPRTDRPPDTVVVSMRDVTAVKRDRQRLARQARYRAGLVRLIEGSLQGNLDQGFYQRVLDAAVEVIPASQTGTLLLRQQDDRFSVVATAGLEEEALTASHLVENAHLVEAARPVLVRRGQRAHLVAPGASEAFSKDQPMAPQVQFSVPVVVAGRTVACFILNNYDHPDAFPAEAIDMSRIFATLVGSLWRRAKLEAEIVEERARVDHGVYHDPLTQLPNRVLLQDRLEQAMAQTLRSGRPLALLFLDLDDFRSLNEKHGHELGDRLLDALGRRLQMRLRDVDTVARWGGDEFVVLLTNLRDAADAARVADKIVQVMNEPVHLGGLELRTGVTVGIDVFPYQATTSEDLLRHADMALYRAKLKGKNRWLFFTAEMNEDLGERFDLERALADGLRQDQFVLHYQPRVEMSTLRITGVEALLRWKRPGHGLIPAGDIIGLAEAGDLIHDLGSRVLDDACARARFWHNRGIHVRMAVNLSAVQLDGSDITTSVADALARYRLDPDILELEVTEAGVMRSMESSAETLRGLQALGVRISLDDFGTAYSSLGYLARLAPSILKIDRSFVAALDDDPTRTPTEAGVVQAIVALGKSLSTTLIAEGVETSAQHRALRLLGCDEAQGYLYGRPMPADQLEPLLARGRIAFGTTGD